MTTTVASLAVKVSADTSQAQSGLGGLLKMIGPGGGLALGAVAIGAAIAGIGIASIKMAGDFQQGMTSLVTGAGESEKNIGLISAGVLKMAVSTGTSTQQLTAGLYMIESSGIHGAAALDVLKAAAEGAKVGNADLGTVADATTTILTDFGGHGLTAANAVNLLIATTASGKTHMADLAGAMAQILPTASAAHVGLNDVMGAMATMTAEGVPAANSATYLRQTILALDAPSAAAKKAMEAVGLSSSAIAEEMQKSLPGALQMVTQRLAAVYGEGTPAYVAALKEISGGSKQMQGMLDLTGTHMAAFVGNISGVSDAVKKGGKQIVGWSDVQKDFNFKMAQAGEVVQTLMIQLGTKLLPVATQVATMFVNDAVPALTMVIGAIGKVISIGAGLITFLQGTGPAATIVKGVLLILAGAMLGMAASAIPALVASIIASVTAFGAQTVAAIAATAATLAAMAPFLLVGAAIGLLVGIIILAVTHWQQITATIGNFITHGAVPVKIAILILLGPIGLIITAVILAKTHWQDITAVLGNFAGMLGNVAGDVAAFVGNVLNFFGALPGKLLNLGLQMIQALARGISNGAGAVGNAIHSLPLIGGAMNAAGALFQHFATGGTMQGDGVAIVGENGPELVRMPGGSQITPIAQGGSGVSGLPAGMSQALGLATASQGGTPLPINVYLDGRQVAQVVVQYQPSVVRSATGNRSF